VIPEIEALVETYRTFYKPVRPCGCTEEHPYPHNVDTDGKPAVCLAHEWDRQQRLLHNLLEGNGLSLPIPPDVRPDDKLEGIVGKAGSRIYENPVTNPSKLVVANRKDDGALATNIAWYLSQPEWNDSESRVQHIVVYLDRSTVINHTFKGQDLAMRDAVTYSPVLVYWNNRDNRNGSWILNAIRARPYGLAFIVK